MGRDSSVGIETRYGLDGPGIESRIWQGFLHPSRPTLGAHLASYTTGFFPEDKAAGTWRLPLTPSNTAVTERVELYLYSSSGSSLPVLG
jgi:hypothetical protein